MEESEIPFSIGSSIDVSSTQNDYCQERTGSMLGQVIFHPISSTYDVFRWAGNTVDDRVLSPLSTSIASSLLNPFNLSLLIWENIKDSTPQRARDITRIITTMIANYVRVLRGKHGKECMAALTVNL